MPYDHHDPRPLTGAIRHRAHKPWFRPVILVLQVEVRTRLDEPYRQTDWRDAQIEDFAALTELQLKQ